MILAPAIAKLLRERWLASPFKAKHHFVFANTLGRGLDYRDVGEGFRRAVKRAGLQAPGKLTPPLAPPRLRLVPDCERAKRRLRVAPTRPRQPEHHSGGLRAPVFDRADHAATARDALDTSYAATASERPS